MRRLAEYDRRIQTDVGNESELKRSYRQKIAFLVARNRSAEAIGACRAALKAIPDWWRARMGLLYLLAPQDRAVEEAKFRKWADENPTFIHYWLVSKYLCDQGRHEDAIAALEQASQSSLAVQDSDDGRVPDAYAFDAAVYACEQGKPKLALAITDVWERPRGVYTYHNNNLHAFRATAYLALGDFERADADLRLVTEASKSEGLWAKNLDKLSAAVEAKDRSFIYDADPTMGEWTLFDPVE